MDEPHEFNKKWQYDGQFIFFVLKFLDLLALQELKTYKLFGIYQIL